MERSSSPVEKKATRGRRVTVVSAIPRDASKPMSAGDKRLPLRSATDPMRRSSPASRRLSPAFTVFDAMRMCLSVASLTNSCAMTVSQPRGMAAPVMMRTHSPDRTSDR